MDKPTAEVQDSEKMQEEVEKRSNRILEMIKLEGKSTQSGATLLPCSGYAPEEKTQRARHPWSIYDVPVEDMEKAMDRMRTALPKNGWKIVKDGPDESLAKTPTIIADSDDGKFSVKLRLMDERKHKETSLIAITVTSSCFQIAPKASATP
ncbi:hypothetical protein [Streptomyces sp. A5-4]|uniref:hypothetical protein n=1 Tax=Streptomyces sp. A5-4 TaxID=3384771 RepID=UPI003DAA0551